MSERIHVLAQELFGKPSVDDCDLQDVKDLANRYPYFAPAQFLFLEKLKKQNAPEYSAQLQKAVLYYPNPLEFEYFIALDRFVTELEPDEVAENELPSVVEQEMPVEIPQPEPVTEMAPSTASPVEETDPEEKIATTVESSTEAAIEEQMASSIEHVLEQEEEQIKEPSTENNSAPIFEPYHTVDYFASQGIKLLQEDGSKDKFAQQLKSFTEWLKTMKRLPATDVSPTMDASSESKVQHLAEGSVHETDVVTEAMAQVWIKQGNREKAIETYNKLGLLNPSKKAYFAALIENLKRS